jgi:hypothetical protein
MSSTPHRPNFVRLPTTPTTPDRFIPSRDAAGSQTPRESFLLSRSPDRLSAIERLTRTNSTGPDPFSNTLPTPPRTPRIFRRPASVVNIQRFPRSSLTSVTPRQASQGTVWQIGGVAALGDSVAGVSDGRGGMIARGTNAALYTSNFLSRPDQAAEFDVFERRLAAALDIDISSRTIQYTPTNPASSSFNNSPQSAGRRNFSHAGSPARVWEDSEWKQPGNIAGLSLIMSIVLSC